MTSSRRCLCSAPPGHRLPIGAIGFELGGSEMADAGLFIGWGPVVRGREQRALEVFNQAMQYYSELQQKKEIESFEVTLLEQHGGDLPGFILIPRQTAPPPPLPN